MSDQNSGIAEKLGYAFGILLVILAAILGLGLLSGLIYGAWVLALSLPDIISSSSPEVLAAIIITIGSLLSAFFVHIAERYFSNQREIREAHRERKVEVYTDFFDNIIGFLQESAKDTNSSVAKKMEMRLVPFLKTFTRSSLLWCSPNFLKKYSEMKQSLSDDPYKGMILMDDIIREIRKDLGHSNRGLEKGDCWKMFLSDPEEFDEILKGNIPNKDSSANPLPPSAP